MKNKKIVTLLSAVAVAVGLVGGTLAWLTFHESLPNHFGTSGNKLHTTIVEHFNPDIAKDMKPGTKVQKEVTIKNDGKIAELVRVKVTPTWDSKELQGKSPAIDNVTLTYADNLTDNWYKDGGYYYYKKILQPGESTSDLLEAVTLNKNLDFTTKVLGTELTYANQGLTVNVESDSVQTTEGAAEDAWKIDKDNTGLTNVLKSLYTKDEVKANGSIIQSTTKTGNTTNTTTTTK